MLLGKLVCVLGIEDASELETKAHGGGPGVRRYLSSEISTALVPFADNTNLEKRGRARFDRITVKISPCR